MKKGNVNIQQTQQLLQKYRDGLCTEAEVRLLHQWYEDLHVSTAASNIDEARFEATLLSKVRTPAKVRPMRLYRALAAAAVIGVLVLTGAYLLKTTHHNSTPAIMAFHSVNNTGQGLKKVQLPDSTMVWLNSGAVLTWSDDYAISERKVKLDGEAYFDVQRDPEHPFLLQSKDVTTRVLGTAFNVEAYPNEGLVRVALVKGKLALTHSGKDSTTAILTPGQVAVLNKGAATFSISEQPTADYAAWMNGAFVLKQVPLEDALQRLCSKYGYTLKGELPASVRLNPITGTFYHENVQNIIANILYVNYLKYAIRGKVIYIKS